MNEHNQGNLSNFSLSGCRDWLNHHSAVASAGLVLVLVFLAMMMVQRITRPHQLKAPPEVTFYDVVTRQIFRGPAASVAPIQTADGHEAVRIHLFTCSDCSDQQLFVGYYEKYTLEAKTQIEKPWTLEGMHEPPYKSILFCPWDANPAEAKNWVSAPSPAGQKIIDDLHKRCGERTLRFCP